MRIEENKKAIINEIDKLAYKYGTYKVFSDFVICAGYALANAVQFNQEREDRFNKIVTSYNTDVKDIFASMLANLYDAYSNDEVTDILGDIYEELNLSKKTNGQFFTPISVCKIMTDLTLSDEKEVKDNLSKKGYLTVNDPACGSGRLLYTSYRKLIDMGISNDKILLLGDDVDLMCCCMAYIGLTFMGANAIISHQNTLTMDKYDTFYTSSFIVNKELRDKFFYDLTKDKESEISS